LTGHVAAFAMNGTDAPAASNMIRVQGTYRFGGS
jgi:hypothetical protein